MEMEMEMEMMMMMIPMKSSSMTVTMAMISPLREGISPGRFLPAGELFLSSVFRLEEAALTILDDPPRLRVSGR